jgi:hypothetical protein
MGAPAALVETWTLYAVGSLIIFARIFVRWRTIGISNWQPDDYLIILSWVRSNRPRSQDDLVAQEH